MDGSSWTATDIVRCCTEAIKHWTSGERPNATAMVALWHCNLQHYVPTMVALQLAMLRYSDGDVVALQPAMLHSNNGGTTTCNIVL